MNLSDFFKNPEKRLNQSIENCVLRANSTVGTPQFWQEVKWDLARRIDKVPGWEEYSQSEELQREFDLWLESMGGARKTAEAIKCEMKEQMERIKEIINDAQEAGNAEQLTRWGNSESALARQIDKMEALIKNMAVEEQI